jgi:hypothetical protein
LLVYLVDEEMGIYIDVLVLVLPPCQPGTAQPGPSATSVSRISTNWLMAATPWPI